MGGGGSNGSVERGILELEGRSERFSWITRKIIEEDRRTGKDCGIYIRVLYLLVQQVKNW